LSAIVPWTVAASVYIWLVLTAAGVSMFLLARRWLERRAALFAAVLYAVNPYHLVIVYWRSAFAELLAACLLPLLLLFILKAVEDEQQRIMVPLGIVLAAAWLTNAPAAVMIHYSMALLIVFFAVTKRSPRLLLEGAAAVALGACLASFYLLPAVYEQKWIDIGEAVSAGSRPADNFLFIHTTDPDHDAFNRIISWVAVLEITVIAAAAMAAKVRKRLNFPLWQLLGWGAVCAFLLFPVSLVFWKILPKMQFMQFPWRWLLCISLIFSIFVALGLQRWWMRTIVCVLSILVVAAAWTRVQAPWWDNAADLREMQDNMESGAGYEGTDEYTPVGADPAAVDKTARDVTVDGPARAAIHVLRWTAAAKEFTAQLSSADQLALKLFPYPAWKVQVNGHSIPTSVRKSTGQILIPVQAGLNRVQIRFVRTWDRTAGAWISAVTFVVVLFWFLRPPRRAPVLKTEVRNRNARV